MPYQLHCCAQVIAELDEPIDELTTDDDDGLDDADDGLEDADDGADEDAGVPTHTAPLIVGRSSAPPFLFNWKPKLTV